VVAFRLENRDEVPDEAVTPRPHTERAVLAAAGPRNQHYLHEVVIVRRPLISPTSKRRQRGTGAWRLRSPEHCRQVALQLDFELALLRGEDDGVDKTAQSFSGAGTALLVFQASRQLRHLLPVKVRHVRMEQGRRLD